MAEFVTVNLTDGRGEVTLNKDVVASVRPQTTGKGSLIICAGGAVYAVEDSFHSVSTHLAAR